MKEIICQECGAENPAGYSVCKKCEADLSDLFTDYKRRTKQEERERKEERMERKREEIRATTHNPAIPWMILGFILVIIGLFMMTTAIASPPQQPTAYEYGYDWEHYADEVQSNSDVIFWGGMIELIGFLIFMPATIWGVSWNVKRLHVHE